MSKLILPSMRNRALIYVGVACIIGLIVSLSLGMLFGFKAGYSGLLGVLVWCIPNVYAAHRIFSNMSPRAAKQIVWNFYLAESVKLLLSGILFVLLVKWVSLALGGFLTGYLSAQLGFWLAPWLFSKN